VIDAEFCFLQMEGKSISIDAVKFGQPMLGVSSEALDAIDVIGAKSKLVISVIDAMMPRIAEIDQTVMAHPAIGVNDRFQIAMATNHRS